MRISIPKSLPPGSRDKTTVSPSCSSHAFSNLDWVDLPIPSPPSNAMKTPFVGAPVMLPSSPFSAFVMSDHNETLGRSFICLYEISPIKDAINPAIKIVTAAPL